MGCGDGLVGDEYHGEVLAEMTGYVHVNYWNPTLQPIWEENADQLRIAMFWGGPNGTFLQEQQIQAETEFPAKYTLKIYSPPPESSFQEVEGVQGRVAIGMPMLYIDVNGDGIWDHEDDEPLVGSPYDTVMVYSAEEFEASEIGPVEWVEGKRRQTFEPVMMPPGYHLMDGYVDLCYTTVWPFAQVKKNQVDIVVDEFWDEMIDPNCDGKIDEWCPEDMSEHCEDPESVPEGTWMEVCVQEQCG